jgi:hypothetical protein
MAKIIPIQARRDAPPHNLITARPWEFRWPDWQSAHFTQISRSRVPCLEAHHQEAGRRGRRGLANLPAHFTLKGGAATTVQALYLRRDNEEKMRDVYYLAGLVDCLINRVNPLLRTDLLRAVYGKIMTLKSLLDLNWHGPLDQVLLPIDPLHFDDRRYRDALSRAATLEGLYRIIRTGTAEMFDVLSLAYVFYTPGKGASP